MVLSMGAFLAIEGRFDGYEDCGFGPFPASCAAIQQENLDSFVAWRKTPLEPAQLVEATLASWYGGDCGQATFLSGTEFNDVYSADDCASGPTQPPASPIRMMDYESILGAEVSVDSCETLSTGDTIDVTCEVRYSNAMSQAVGKPPAVTAREFSILVDAILTDIGGEQAGGGLRHRPNRELRQPHNGEHRRLGRLVRGQQLTVWRGSPALANWPICIRPTSRSSSGSTGFVAPKGKGTNNRVQISSPVCSLTACVIHILLNV
jgi:hypothetical protein